MLVLVRGKLSMGDTWHVGRLPDISKYESGECCLPPLGEQPSLVQVMLNLSPVFILLLTETILISLHSDTCYHKPAYTGHLGACIFWPL